MRNFFDPDLAHFLVERDFYCRCRCYVHVYGTFFGTFFGFGIGLCFGSLVIHNHFVLDVGRVRELVFRVVEREAPQRLLAPRFGVNGAVNRRLLHRPQDGVVDGCLPVGDFVQRLVRGDGLIGFSAGVPFAQLARHPHVLQRGVGHVHHRFWVRGRQQRLFAVRRRLLVLGQRLQLRFRVHHQVEEHFHRAQLGRQVLVAANAPGASHHLLNAHRVPVRLQNVHVPHVAQVNALRTRRRNHERVDDLAVKVVARHAQQHVPDAGRHLVPLAVVNAADDFLFLGGFRARVQRKPALARVFRAFIQHPLLRRRVVFDAELRVVVGLHRHFH